MTTISEESASTKETDVLSPWHWSLHNILSIVCIFSEKFGAKVVTFDKILPTISKKKCINNCHGNDSLLESAVGNK